MTWVHDQIFAAGGRIIPATWGTFMNQTGISAILHFRPERPERFVGPPAEKFLWLDVADESQAGLNERRLAATFLQDCVTDGRRVLVHSSLGFHRTRWAYVAFLIRAGCSVGAALRSATDAPWLAPYHTHQDAWNEFAEICRAERVRG